jgi:hypothetical protein
MEEADISKYRSLVTTFIDFEKEEALRLFNSNFGAVQYFVYIFCLNGLRITFFEKQLNVMKGSFDELLADIIL